MGFLGENIVLVLSGYSPWLTKSVYDEISPAQAVWSGPDQLLETNAIHGLSDVVKLFDAEEVTIPLAVARDTISHAMHKHRFQWEMQPKLLTLIVDEVLVCPHLLLTYEGVEFPKSNRRTTRGVPWAVFKTQRFIDVVRDWM